MSSYQQCGPSSCSRYGSCGPCGPRGPCSQPSFRQPSCSPPSYQQSCPRDPCPQNYCQKPCGQPQYCGYSQPSMVPSDVSCFAPCPQYGGPRSGPGSRPLY